MEHLIYFFIMSMKPSIFETPSCYKVVYRFLLIRAKFPRVDISNDTLVLCISQWWPLHGPQNVLSSDIVNDRCLFVSLLFYSPSFPLCGSFGAPSHFSTWMSWLMKLFYKTCQITPPVAFSHLWEGPSSVSDFNKKYWPLPITLTIKIRAKETL